MKEKNKKLILTLSCIGILCIFIGVTYAIISFVFQGNREHTIDIKGISFSYEEQENGLSLTKLTPMTDSEGLSSGNDYTFVVSATSQTSQDVPYYVYLTIDNENTLKSEYVRLNITNETTSTTIGPINANELSLKANNDFYLMGDTFSFDGVTTSMSHTYKLTIWVNEDYEKSLSYTSSNNEQTTTIGGETFNFKINVSTGVVKLDSSNANTPELATNMIPVYYDETNEVWKKADETNSDINNKWYDYNSKMWANAVTVSNTNRATYLSADAGTAISMDDINTMWVWIPRFSATGDTANYNGGIQTNPGAFNITFVDNKTSAHDAFTFGTQELNGIWVGKFETSHETLSSSTSENNLGCTSDVCSNANGIIIKPNVVSLRWNNVSNFFYAGLSMKQSGNSFGFDTSIDTTLDTHMMKNNEWGAVAYLTQSIYGRCTSSTSCEEVSINNSSGYYTGRSGGAPGVSSTAEGTYKYNENKIETSVVGGTNVSTTITNDSTYPWVNTDGVYSSSNNGQDSTTATLTYSFTLSSKGVVSFDYSVSSESGYDEMSYVINNGTTDVVTGDVISGTSRGTTESSLSYDNKVHILDEGTYTLTFTYSKDSLSASGLDKGYVKNVKVLAGATTITKEFPAGQLASTTGNIYGIYDMSGGALEFVMGVYTDGTQNWSGYDSTYHSGFSGCLGSSCSSTYDGLAYPESRYYNSYTNTGTKSSPITNYTSDMQHALIETKNWFGDDAYFVNGDDPWFIRGGYYSFVSNAGVFGYNYFNGLSYYNVSVRFVSFK